MSSVTATRTRTPARLLRFAMRLDAGLVGLVGIPFVAIIVANALFTVLFLGLAAASGWPLTSWGYALLIAGAGYTAVIGAVQYAGLRRITV